MFLIDGQNIEIVFGAFFVKGALNELNKGAEYKERFSYDWKDESGLEYDLDESLKKQPTQYSIPMFFPNGNRFDAFRMVMESSASRGFFLQHNSAAWHLYFNSFSNYKRYTGGALTVTLNVINNWEVTKQMTSPPTAISYNEQARRIDFVFNPAFTNISDYQYTLDGGTTWLTLTNKPLGISPENGYIANSIGVRVKETEDNYASDPIFYSENIQGSVAPPTAFVFNTDTWMMDFTFSPGITSLSRYELSMDTGASWSDLASKPFEIPNDNFPANSIQVRVKETETNYASVELKYATAIEKEENVVTFSVELPGHIDPEDVELIFPKLKFNKKFVFSYITDDSYSIYNYIFSGINKRYVATKNPQWFFHLNTPKEPNFNEGITPEYPLQFSDGAGNMRRFATSVAGWPDKLIDQYIGFDVGYQWPWISEKEFKLFRDFGFTLMYHDLLGYDGGSVNQENFNTWFANTKAGFIEAIGDSPKAMAEPNGDHRYLALSQSISDIVMNTAQSGDPLIKKVYPHRGDFTLEKSQVAVERFFYNGNNYSNEVFSRLENFNTTNNVDTIYWLIGSSHRSDLWEYDLFKRINDNFGAIGSDLLWFATMDEVFEYWYLTSNAIVSKSIQGQTVTFNLSMPKMPRFWFNEVSCLLEGVSNDAGVSVISNTEGLSYGVNGDRLLVNLNFNNLVARAEKYTALFEASPSSEYRYDDALYMISQLKQSMRQPYLDRINVFTSPPVLTDFKINGGAAQTQQENVNLSFTYTGTVPSEYLASENSGFSGAVWSSYSSPAAFALSAGFETKTVYVKLRNSWGESNVLTAQIYRAKPNLVLNSISAPAQASASPVPVTLNYSGIPTHYRLAPTNDFTGIGWEEMEDDIVFFVTGTPFGQKQVYAQLYDELEDKTSTVATTSFEYVDATSAILSSIVINDGDSDTASGNVSVKLNAINSIDEYRIGMQADLSDANWQAWTGDTVNYNSGLTTGVLTVYAQVRNATSTSVIRNDSINIVQPVTISALVLAGGQDFFAGLSPSVSFTVTQGNPTHYRLAETEPALANATWLPWSSGINYQFGSLGAKTLYGQIRNTVSTSEIRSDSITLTEPPLMALVGFNGASNNSNAKIVTSGLTTNQITPAIHASYSPQQLVDTGGANITGMFLNLHTSFYAANNFFGAGNNLFNNAFTNASQASGIYSLETIMSGRAPSTSGAEEELKKGRISFTLPVGRYRFRILWNTGGTNFTIQNESMRLNSWYGLFQGDTELDKTICSNDPAFTGLHNQEFNAEMEIEITEASTPVDLGLWTTVTSYRPGVNLIEITKLV